MDAERRAEWNRQRKMAAVAAEELVLESMSSPLATFIALKDDRPDVQCDAVAIDISDESTSDELYAAALRGDPARGEPIYQSPYGYPQHQQHQQPLSMQPPGRSTRAVDAYSMHGSEIQFGGDEARNTWVPTQQVQPWERSHHRVSPVLETDSEVGTSVLSDYGDELGEEQLEELDANPARHTVVNCRMQQRGTEHGRYQSRRRPAEKPEPEQPDISKARRQASFDRTIPEARSAAASLPVVLDREGVPARASVQKCQYCNRPMPLTGNRECPGLSGPYNEGFGRFYHYGGYDDTRDYVDTPYCRALNHGTELDTVKNPLVNCRMQADPTELQTRRDALQLQVAEAAERLTRLTAEKTKLEQLLETAKIEAARAEAEEATRQAAEEQRRAQSAAQEEAHRLEPQKRQVARQEIAAQKEAQRLAAAQQAARQAWREKAERRKAVRVGYHGTTQQAAKQIIRYGFTRSTGGMLGPGVYWSDDIKKALRYPLNSNPADRVTLLLHVRPGKTKKVNLQNHPLQHTWHNHGYDTAWVPPNNTMVGSGLSEDCTWDPTRIEVVGVSRDKGTTWEFVSDEARVRHRERERVQMERQQKEMERRKCEAAKLHAQARSLVSGKDYGGAVRTFNKALSLDPHNQVLRRERDEAATINRKEIERVKRERQQKEIERRKCEAAELWEQARSLASGKDYGGAVLKFDGALVLDPSNCGLRRERDKAATKERKQIEWVERKARIARCMRTFAIVVSLVAMTEDGIPYGFLFWLLVLCCYGALRR